jgi:alpha-glucosidase
MHRWFWVLGALFFFESSQAQAQDQWQVSSPNGSLVVSVRQTPKGQPEYAANLNGRRVIEWSPLGLSIAWVDQGKPDAVQHADFAKTVTFGAARRKRITDHYSMLTGKRRVNHYQANAVTLPLTDDETGKTLDLEFQIADDGIAFRYLLTGTSLLFHWVEREDTGFNFGPGGMHWGQVYDKASAWQPAYEAPYTKGVPIGTSAPATEGPGWGIPALFHDEGGAWILLHEAGLTRDFYGSHLMAEAPSGAYRLAPPLAADGMGVGSAEPMMTLPAATPWRFMVISSKLSDIVQSNRVFDLSPPAPPSDTSWIKPGVASWSWLTDHDSSRDLKKLKAHIGLAADMGWGYSLVDANWNLIAPDAMEQLVAEGKRKGIGLLFWYNSGGRHNAVTEEPRNIMDDRAKRRAEFAKLERLGVKGVKIDFFHSDKQDRIAQYIDILEDAAVFHLLVNFHGCTIPRGWQRTYPHLMTMEAVRGGEHYSFDSLPDFAQLSTYQNSVLPYTRNVIGSMDFTPIGFSKQNRPHLTTNAQEAALGVVFESGILHMADSVAGYAAASTEYKLYLAELPTVWDETRFLSGYPGRDYVVARRAGNRWYVAGINSENKAKTVRIDLGFLGKSGKALVLHDGEDRYGFYSHSATVSAKQRQMQMAPYGGFVMVVD